MKKILILARAQYQLDEAFDTFIEVLSSRKELVVTIMVGDHIFHDAVTPNSEYDLIVVLCEYGFLVQQIIALEGEHKPILCIDIYDEEEELERAVDSMPEVYLLGFAKMDVKLATINKILKTEIFKLSPA